MSASTRVSLAPLGIDDCGLAARWISDRAINQWLYSEWREGKVDDRAVAIVAMNKAKNRLYVIHFDNRPVGLAAISQISQADLHASVWYLIGEGGVEGRGVGTAAVRDLAQIAFTELGLASLEASVLAGNKASERVLLKNGFKLVGVLRKASKLGQELVDRAIFELLSEWVFAVRG